MEYFSCSLKWARPALLLLEWRKCRKTKRLNRRANFLGAPTSQRVSKPLPQTV